ncbi:MAG: amidohydrolase family protein [Chloroflexota bacterium]
MNDRMRSALRLLASSLLLLGATAPALAAPAAGPVPAAPGPVTLFQNVRVFDGKGGAVSGPSDVLVRGNKIERISPAGSIPPGAEAGATVIPGGGRVLMPGLIDAHWHTMLVATPGRGDFEDDPSYMAVVAVPEASRVLMRGFTTVRDVGGNCFALKNTIDQGLVVGPRIYPSGAIISVTSGHGDFRNVRDLPRTLGAPGSFIDHSGHSTIADSPDEVRLRVREQLMRGAVHIKLTAGGGVSSPHSPLDVVTFNPLELRAAVDAAGNWGTYVMVHAYTPAAIGQAIDAGVKVIEHASLMDDATAQRMAKNGIWLSAQAFPIELGTVFPPGSVQAEKFKDVFEGTDRTFKLARKHGIKTAFGTDMLFSSALAQLQGRVLASLTQWYTPAETLVMATGTNAELLQLTGKRNPYPGKLGVVEAGALADLLLVDGNPVENIQLLANPDKNLLVIMKDGQVYKNLVGQPGR